jgi:trans-aconitate methyltransferase
MQTDVGLDPWVRPNLTALTPPWMIDGWSVQATELMFTGPAEPFAGDPTRTTFAVDGRLVDDLEWFPPAGARTGYHYRCSTEIAEPPSGGPRSLEISYVLKGLNQPINAWQNIHLPIVSTHDGALPDAERLVRVVGHSDAQRYLLYGHSVAMQLERAVARFSTRPLSSMRSVLDWGCGAGRIIRHLSRRSSATFTGVDIDHDNIGWCAQHLQGIDFQTVTIHPPTTLPAAAHDLIYGISVITHIDAAGQRAWLEELRRLIAADGLVMLTVNGATALGATPDEVVAQVVAEGFDASRRDPRLDAVITDHSYYRTSFQSHQQVGQLVAGLFDVIDILPCFNASVQDLVVLRPTLR